MINKNELKKKYKETLPPMGVYQIKNLKNGKVFIGSSKNLPGKENSTFFQLKMGSYYIKELQQDYKESGADNFVFEVLDYLEPKEGTDYNYTKDLEALEELWLEKLKPYGDRGYNKYKSK